MAASDSVEVMVARIDENVRHLKDSDAEDKKALAEHVAEDKKIISEYLRPLWEVHQQNIGASKAKKIGGMLGEKAITVGLAVLGAWAALKGLPK